MSTPTSFQDFIQRSARATTRGHVLVRRYEPPFAAPCACSSKISARAAVRFHDLCQSVLASFFVARGGGEYDWRRPGQLVGLVVKRPATSRLGRTAGDAATGDHRRQVGAATSWAGIAGSDPTPSAQVAGQELLERRPQGLPKRSRRDR